MSDDAKQAASPFAKLVLGCVMSGSSVVLVGGCFLGLLVPTLQNNISKRIDRIEPPRLGVAPNYEEETWELEATNPSTVAVRVTRVSFQVKARRPPQSLIGDIELQEIIFDQSDYDSKTRTYNKVLNGIEMPAQGNLNFKFLVKSPGYKDHYLIGVLTLFWGDRDNPSSQSLEYEIKCID